MTRKTVVLVIAGMAVAGAGGYWLGARSSDSRGAEGEDWSRELTRAYGDKEPSGVPSERPSAALLEAQGAESLNDPHQAISRVLALPDGSARRSELMKIARAWAAPADAWEQASHLADPVARWALQNAIVTPWASQQPELAFATVAAMPADWQRDQLLRQVTTEVARRNPQLALELLTTAEIADRDSFHALIVEEWSNYDPSGAAQWVEKQEKHRQAPLAYRLADAYVAQQPSEALAWALRISRSPGRNLWSHMLQQMAVHDPHEALRLALAAENPAQRRQALNGVLASIARRDPALAISQLEKVPAGEARTQTIAGIARQIAETSPAAALDWLESLDDREARFHALIQMGQGLAARDVDGAAQLIDRVPEGARRSWITSIANAYIEEDVEKGIQWVRKYRDEPGYANAVARVASVMAMRSPEAALEVVERTLDGRERDQAIANTLPMVAMQAPQVASHWVDEIADESARAQAVEHVAGAWGRYDFPAAQKWLQSMQPGLSRDRGLMHLAAGGQASVDETVSLIGQIQSQDQRLDAVLMAAARIGRRDPDGMRALLRRYPLDPPRQQQLESELKQSVESWGWDGW